MPAAFTDAGAVESTDAEGAKSSPALATRVKEIIVVCKTHFDIGFTDLAVNVVDMYRNGMMDRAVATFEGTADLPRDSE